MSASLIRQFWDLMSSNDFDAVIPLLHPEFEYFMPQTGEYLAGPDRFAALNAAFPAEGLWRFDVRSIVADTTEGVSDVAITDGDMQARAVTFHSIVDGLIRRQVEYWPDPYDPPSWRAAYTRVLTDPPF